MPVSLARILANRPRGGQADKEWIGLYAKSEQTWSMGNRIGHWDPTWSALPELSDQGLLLTLQEALVTRCDRDWGAGIAAVWEITACQEESEFVPGVPVFLHPDPPCLLCQPCVDGDFMRCLEAGTRRWGPGWIALQTVVPPWTVRRGLVELPPRASRRASLFLEPLAGLHHALAPMVKKRPSRVVVLGADLPGVLTGFALERMIPDSLRCLVEAHPGRREVGRQAGFHHLVASPGEIKTVMAAPELVVVATTDPEMWLRAIELCAPGGTVLSLLPPSSEPAALGLAGIWQRGIHLVAGRGCAPWDRQKSVAWLEDLSERLGRLNVAEIPFDQAPRAAELLAAEPSLLGVVLRAVGTGEAAASSG